MNLIGKTYTLRNGNKISKAECYDGYDMRYFWVVMNKGGKVVASNLGSYEKAYKIASDLGAFLKYQQAVG